ncbi:hypothetical protein [Uliginosibacterium sp. H1]|uniref:hypothetical protein n=1 Tax=Uliginosibacterium sp. H1 TaxID=3114757 RepID=UPI002E19701B|nr:hypothetical protein [Uliginosibacterium sp. H1]
MKRCLCVLVLMCLSVQSVWAAVGVYCGAVAIVATVTIAGVVSPAGDAVDAEASRDCPDPCHGMHAAEAGADEAASSTADCGSCHGHQGAALLPGLASALRPAGHAAPSAVTPLLQLLLPVRPERPDWIASSLA